jgi:anti-sigma factor RsiW
MTATLTPNDDLLISAWLDDELDPAPRQELEHRLDTDAALRARLEIMALQADILENPGDDHVPAQLQNRIDAILDEGFEIKATQDDTMTGMNDGAADFAPSQPAHDNDHEDNLNGRAPRHRNVTLHKGNQTAAFVAGSLARRDNPQIAHFNRNRIADTPMTTSQPRETAPMQGRAKTTHWWASAGIAAALAVAFVAGGWYGRTTSPMAPLVAANGSDTKVDNAGLDMLINETLETTQSGQVKRAALATNSEKIGQTTIEPLRTFQLQGRFCREYRANIDLGQEKPITFFGRACRDPKEGWQTVYRLFPGSGVDLGPEPLATHQNL